MTDPRDTAVRALLDAIARYDEDRIASMVAGDAAIIVPDRPVYQGPAGAAEMIKDLSRTYVEWNTTPVRVITDSNSAVAEWTCTITDFGGSESMLDGCAVIDFDGDKISRARFYFRPEDRQR